MSTVKTERNENLNQTDANAVKAIKELASTVVVKVTGPLEHNGIRYQVGEEVVMSRDIANFHLEHNNCTIVN